MDWKVILEVSAGVVAVSSVIFARLLQQTITTLKENNDALKDRVQLLEEETKHCLNNHNESLREINNLKGELKVLKEIPLVKLEAESRQKLEAIERISRTQDKIMEVLTQHIDGDEKYHDRLTKVIESMEKKI